LPLLLGSETASGWQEPDLVRRVPSRQVWLWRPNALSNHQDKINCQLSFDMVTLENRTSISPANDADTS
jgi:hypothetical protein